MHAIIVHLNLNDTDFLVFDLAFDDFSDFLDLFGLDVLFASLVDQDDGLLVARAVLEGVGAAAHAQHRAGVGMFLDDVLNVVID